jgi:acetolactate synthase-1/2/3 large subunit
MPMDIKRRTGGELIVDGLRAQGVDTIFCVPGESYLAVLDALYDRKDSIRTVVCRHEGGAAFMAEAYGKLTGRPGVCFVTRGPGATNASIGVHSAMQASTPMLLFVGQVQRDALGREAFQEIDHSRMFAPIAKWATEIADPARIPEALSRAFHVALGGRPGPVVVALPEDMLAERAAVADAPRCEPIEPDASAQTMASIAEELAGAERPLLLIGGSGWREEGRADIAAFAERNLLPVVTSFRRQDLFDNRHRCFAGEAGVSMFPSVARRLQEADVLLACGSRLGETTTASYTHLAVPAPRQRLVHVHPSSAELGKVFAPRLAVQCGPNAFARLARELRIPVRPSRRPWLDGARRDYLSLTECPPQPGALDMGEVTRLLQRRLPDDAIITNGAGNFTVWPNKFFQFNGRSRLLAPQSGAMGYGVPAAVAASLAAPGRVVVCFSGDGDFLMNGQELATAAQHGGKPIVLVVNNGMLGTIRMHQERHFPGRVIATGLGGTDFVSLARGYGFDAARVAETAAFAPALERALASPRGTLIELMVDPEGITPRETLSGLRAQGGGSQRPR